MGHQNGILAKIQKFRQYSFDKRCIHYHTIVNTRQFFNSKRNWYLWIYERRKPVCNFPIYHFYSSDFDNAVADRGKSGRFDIKYHECATEILSLFICNNFLQIIDQICFHTINDFKEILFIRVFVSVFYSSCFFCFPQIFPDMIGIRECLHNTMVRNGNCRMSPFVRAFNNIFCF